MIGSCTCPATIAMKNHRDDLKVIWRSNEWKEANKIFHNLHLDNTCDRCGQVGTIVPGHTSEDYLDMVSYITKVRENRCTPLCPRCNRNESKGKRPCPSCIEKHKTDPEHWIRYIGQDQETCGDCIPEEERELRASRKSKFKKFVRTKRDKDNENRRRIYRNIQRGVSIG